jgi:hypothetical protein
VDIDFALCLVLGHQLLIISVMAAWPIKFTEAGLFNDLITAILDIFRKSNIYGPKGKKIRITKI